MGTFELRVDAREAEEMIRELSTHMTQAQFNRALGGVFRRTTNKVRRILKKDVPIEYNVKAPEVGAAVKNGSITSGLAGGMGCVVPITDSRKHIGGGGRGYPAWGSRSGWASLHSGSYPILTQIYRGSRGRLPSTMSGKSYGGYPPFRNVPSTLHGITFTYVPGSLKGDARGSRWNTKSRRPIQPVMGPAIPQMPMNKAKDHVQLDIRQYLEKEVAHRLHYFLISGR